MFDSRVNFPNSLFNSTAEHWPCVKRFAGTTHLSLVAAHEAQKVDSEEADTVSALASLSMVAGKRRWVFYFVDYVIQAALSISFELSTKGDPLCEGRKGYRKKFLYLS